VAPRAGHDSLVWRENVPFGPLRSPFEVPSEAKELWVVAPGEEAGAGPDSLQNQTPGSRVACVEPSEIVFEVDEACYALGATPATTLAEQLRLTATGLHRFERRFADAIVVADAIEDVLVGRSAEPIPLGRDGAEAVFYLLDVAPSPSQPEYALYTAVRGLHNRLRED
jgi:hypothetical protein